MRHAAYLAPFGDLADPVVVADAARLAESAGFDGLFLWDHLWRPSGPVQEVGDVWVSLAAAACATTSLRLAPMVVPLARRRPQRVARETVALDRLSGGRLTLGIGLGVDTGGELARFGEVADDRARADVLDEALEVLLGLWSGEEVHHQGPSFVVDGARFVPRAVQQPRIPVWGAARGGGGMRPLRRAARLDGLFPVRTTTEELVAMLEVVRMVRGTLEGFDVALAADGAADDELAALGVTWRVHAVAEGTPWAEVQERLAAGPHGSGPRPR